MLFRSGDHTWAETGPLQGEVGFDENQERQGPLDIGVALDREVASPADSASPARQQRILVIGDGDFLSNAYVGNSGNQELGIRLINWLASDDEFITIPARTAPDLQLELAPLIAGAIAFGFLIALPLLLFGAGAFIWWRRRKQ